MFDQMTANLKTSMAEKQKIIAKCLDFLLEKAVEDNFEEVDNLQSELTSGSLQDEFRLLNSRLARVRCFFIKRKLFNFNLVVRYSR